MDRKKEIIYNGIAAAIVLVVVVAVVLFFTWPSRHQCIPLKMKPNMSEIQVENVASEEGDLAVANMAGYLELLDPTGGNSTYLPLDIRSLQFSKPDESGGRVVTLGGECLRFEASYSIEEEDSGRNYKFSYLKMLVEDGAKRDKKAENICEFDAPFTFGIPDEVRYSCQKKLSHQCSTAGKPIASLVLKSFELELAGDPDHVRKCEFTKPAWSYSCISWAG